MIGGISVSVTTGLGAAIVTTAQGNNQVRRDDQGFFHVTLMCGSSNTGSCISCSDLLLSRYVRLISVLLNVG